MSLLGGKERPILISRLCFRDSCRRLTARAHRVQPWGTNALGRNIYGPVEPPRRRPVPRSSGLPLQWPLPFPRTSSLFFLVGKLACLYMAS